MSTVLGTRVKAKQKVNTISNKRIIANQNLKKFSQISDRLISNNYNNYDTHWY